jgi:hypothetical protein
MAALIVEELSPSNSQDGCAAPKFHPTLRSRAFKLIFCGEAITANERHTTGYKDKYNRPD